MSRFKPEKREAERAAYCRCCDQEIAKGQSMISWWSHRNRGQFIHICLPCSIRIGKLAKDEEQ